MTGSIAGTPQSGSNEEISLSPVSTPGSGTQLQKDGLTNPPAQILTWGRTDKCHTGQEPQDIHASSEGDTFRKAA